MTRRTPTIRLGLLAAILACGRIAYAQIYEDWTIRYDTGAYAEAFRSVVIDSQGSALVSFDAGLLKYDSTGALQWNIEGSGAELVIDDGDNVYMPRYSLAAGHFELLKVDTAG